MKLFEGPVVHNEGRLGLGELFCSTTSLYDMSLREHIERREVVERERVRAWGWCLGVGGRAKGYTTRNTIVTYAVFPYLRYHFVGETTRESYVCAARVLDFAGMLRVTKAREFNLVAKNPQITTNKYTRYYLIFQTHSHSL